MFIESFSRLSQMQVEHKDDHNRDKLLYLLLNSTVKILTHVNILMVPKYSNEVSQLMEYCKNFLLHPHSWVRTASAQIFGLLFAQYQPQAVANSLGENTSWLLRAGRDVLDDLIMKFLEQFQSRQVPLDLLNQLTKNLLFVAKVKLTLTHPCDGRIESLKGVYHFSEGNVRLTVTFQVLLYLEIPLITGGGPDNPQNGGNQSKNRTFSWFVYKIEKELRHLGSEQVPNLEKVHLLSSASKLFQQNLFFGTY